MSDDAVREFKSEFEFLSNFYPVSIHVDGIDYPSVEHAYQAFKTDDISKKMEIAALPYPGQAKKYGRHISLRPDWDKLKLSFMAVLLYQKFANSVLQEKLLETEDRELIEGNWWHDQYWGVDLRKGLGENNLGKLLMQTRENYKKGW